MYLKEIIINGFKSFPEKTIVKINSELTAVVGPNGSGKSNISDAFKWVMGEQSAKILRGTKMEDVIFVGTEKRKPLGFAEVNLVFDNTSKKIDTEFKEVCITRRLYRTGESEYLLNNSYMKLKDIRELFMDTGIGIDGYSIIGQGRVEDIVSAKSETRRKVIEEAAGIVKYKTRKEETIKKLIKTEENIERVNDIVFEIEKRIGPLRKQKIAAENFLKFRENLKKAELNLYVRDFEKQKEQSEHFNNHLESKGIELINKEDIINKNQMDYELLLEKIKNTENKKNEIEERLNESTNKHLEFINTIKLNEEKKQLYNAERQKITNNINILNVSKEYLVNLIYEIKLDLVKKEEQLTLKNDELTDYENKQNNYLSENNNFQIIIDKKKNDIFEAYNLQSEIKNRINTLDSLVNNYQERIENLKKVLFLNDDAIKITLNNIKTIEKEIQLNNEKIINNKEVLNEIKLKYNAITLDETNSNKLIENIVSKNNESISKKEMLIRMKDSYEGYYKSVQQFMTDCIKKGVFNNEVAGVLAEIIEIDKKYETALEISLGSAMQNIVIQTEKGASPIIKYLKSNNIGRITFLPLDTIKARSLNTSERNALSMNGCIGVLSDLVKFDDKYSNIISFLMGRVIVTDSIENGIKIAKHINYSTKIVTVSGEVINAGGSITGGSIKNNSFSLVSRKREIQELGFQIIKNNKNIDLERINNIAFNKTKNSIEIRIRELNDDLIMLNNEIVNHNASLKYKKEELNNILSSNSKLNEDIIFLEDEKSKYILEKNDLNNQYEKVKNDISSLEHDIEEKNSNFKNSQDYLEDIRTKVTDRRIEITNINNDKNNMLFKITDSEKELNGIESSINNEKEIENEITLKLRKIENEMKEISLLENEVHIKINLNKEDLKIINENKHKYQEALFENQKIINYKNKEINDIILEINSIKIKKEEADNKIELISNNLWDDYEMSYAMSCEYKDESISINKLFSEVRNLKKDIKLLGDVNISSIEEYLEVSERFDFLNVQRDDLESAKNKLNKVINELSSKMKTQFDEEYNKIREQFRNVFIHLFDGGEADIVLSDEEDSLNCDIEIYVQPPGKKLNKISLLSGGEKSLTAIALLFAILRTKPTPFCILDEIEAALDDANVHRFAKYLKEFSKDTQFLVITHRKGTMEYVDTLYGTNMEEQGVTKLVSMKLSKYNK